MDSSAGLAQRERLAIVFPGQGSQMPGMGRALMACHPEAHRRLARLSSVVDTDLEALLCGDMIGQDPVSVHLAMVSFGLVAWEWLTEIREFRPVMLAGHSLGEIVALACSGALSAEEAIRLALVRGRCLAEDCERQPGAMKAFVGVPLDEMQAAIAEWISLSGSKDRLWIVNVNGPRQLVVAGEPITLQALETVMIPQGLTAIPLATAGAFHTPFMNSSALKLAEFLRTLAFRPMRIPVVSSMTGRLLLHHEGLAAHLALQVVKPVCWMEVMRFMRRAQIARIIEAAPGKGALVPLAASCSEWDVQAQTLGQILNEEHNAGATIPDL
jgi:[acyl-carrier-protein] S-malonyltransferase